MGLSPPKSVVEVRLPGYDWYTEDGLCPSHGRFSQRPRQQVPASPEGGTRRNMPVFCESALLNTTIRSDCIEERQVMRDIVAVIRSNPRSRSQVEPCDFCVRRGIFSRLGVKDGQKCPFKDSNVAAIMLTTPRRVSGDHSSLTLFAKILLQLVSLTLHVGWDTALFAGKYPMFT
jgi:hypothetical protein